MSTIQSSLTESVASVLYENALETVPAVRYMMLCYAFADMLASADPEFNRTHFLDLYMKGAENACA